MDEGFTKQKIKELRSSVAENDRIAIVLQDDPDPDAMSSAIALRTLLGRNKQTTPIFAFKPVTRPENLTMTHLLEIEVAQASSEKLRSYNKIAMVDVEPNYFGEKLPHADIVIDHHPGYPTGLWPFEDVRVGYGACATIMTEYLVTAEERISERLATALLYGIRSDTLALSRRVTDNDIRAFVHLYPLANYNLLRQIDRPELPITFARTLAHAMGRLQMRDGLITIYLGPVERDDLIVQVADFCLQFEGVEWVAVGGKLGNNLVIAVRNHGVGRGNAGELVKRLFNDIGNAGGHRNMAKAVIPMRRWRQREGSTRSSSIEPRLRELFAKAIMGEGDPADGRIANHSQASRNGASS